MFTAHTFYRLTGLLFWAGILVCAYVAAQPRQSDDVGESPAQLRDYFLKPAERIEATDVSRRLRVGDPVFVQNANDEWQQIGHVESLKEMKETSVVIVWYGPSSPDEFTLVTYQNSGSLEEVIATMLPEEKRQQIQQRLAGVLRQHGEELSRAFTPLVQDSLRKSMPIIEAEFRRSVQRHRAEVDQLAARWNDQVVSDRLIPMARREILPIVRRHGEPTAEQIGRELWDRASLWRFGWRIVYDRSPLPDRNLAQAEWDRFVEEEAVPVFEAHMDDIVVSIQRTLSDVSANRAVRRELADVASELAVDPQARDLVRSILKESLVENERLKQAWRDVWSSPDAQAAMNLASDRMEPVVRSIGDDLFGTQEEGIDPNFARVLRNQILGKDRRWVIAKPREQSAQAITSRTIEQSAAFMPYPLVYMADRNVTGDPSQ